MITNERRFLLQISGGTVAVAKHPSSQVFGLKPLRAAST